MATYIYWISSKGTNVITHKKNKQLLLPDKNHIYHYKTIN